MTVGIMELVWLKKISVLEIFVGNIDWTEQLQAGSYDKFQNDTKSLSSKYH